MLQSLRPSNETHVRSSARDIFATVIRYYRGLTIWLITCIAFAMVYLYLTVPQYYSSSLVILEPRTSFSSGQGVDPGLIQTNLDISQIESQIQIVKSEQVLNFVFKTLNLQKDPEFAGKTAAASTTPSLRDETAAFQTFSDRVTVRRVGQSLVLEIGFLSRSPARAASIANSVTAAFIRDQIEAKSLSMQRNGEWLQGRIDEIRAQESASEQAIRDGTLPSRQFSASDARIISQATEPLNKASPQGKLILILACAVALLTGLGAISIKHSLDRKVRTKRHVYNELGLQCIGVVPMTNAGKDTEGYRDLLTLSVDEEGALTSFSESLRVTRTTIMGTETGSIPHLIGIVSCLPSEGKSTIAANLAYLFAASGRHTVLVDGDLRRFELTKHFAPEAQSSVCSVLQNRKRQTAVARVSLPGGPDFIAAVNAGKPADINLFVGSTAMKNLLGDLKGFDYAVMDLPAMSISSDVKAIAPLLDSVVLVVEAGRASVEDLTEGLEILHGANVKILGAILNKAPESDLPALLRHNALTPLKGFAARLKGFIPGFKGFVARYRRA